MSDHDITPSRHRDVTASRSPDVAISRDLGGRHRADAGDVAADFAAFLRSRSQPAATITGSAGGGDAETVVLDVAEVQYAVQAVIERDRAAAARAATIESKVVWSSTAAAVAVVVGSVLTQLLADAPALDALPEWARFAVVGVLAPAAAAVAGYQRRSNRAP